MYDIYYHLNILASKYKIPPTWVGALWVFIEKPSAIYVEGVLKRYIMMDELKTEEYYNWIRRERKLSIIRLFEKV